LDRRDQFLQVCEKPPNVFPRPKRQTQHSLWVPPNCLKDLLDGIKILQDRIRTCPAATASSHRTVSMLRSTCCLQVLFLRLTTTRGNAEKNEKRRLAYVLPGDPFNIYLTPRGCASGPAHIAQDLAHEFAHISLGHASEYYNNHRCPRTRTTLLRDKRKLPVVSGFKRRRLSSSRLRERSKGS